MYTFGRQGLVGSSGGYTSQFLLLIGTFEKCLEMGDTQFLLFRGTFEKCPEMRETQFLLFKGTFETSPTACQESVI